MKTGLLLPLTLLALSGCDDEATVLNASPAAPSGGERPGPGAELPAPVDYSSTAFYEVTPAGVATKLFDVEGWAFKTLRLR